MPILLRLGWWEGLSLSDAYIVCRAGKSFAIPDRRANVIFRLGPCLVGTACAGRIRPHRMGAYSYQQGRYTWRKPALATQGS
ncbi:hypothetical protein F5Y10DRAFT_235167 [Nemania abortiva]|nr:hypothetical protein F5Y10DRAFT_235167 [Nemania abortiva]